MKTNENPSHQESHACQCPACSSEPARTYTPEFMQECLARWYVNASAQQREEYLAALRRQHGWQTRLDSLRDVATSLGLPTYDFPKTR